MKKLILMLLFVTGCFSDRVSGPISPLPYFTFPNQTVQVGKAFNYQISLVVMPHRYNQIKDFTLITKIRDSSDVNVVLNNAKALQGDLTSLLFEVPLDNYFYIITQVTNIKNFTSGPVLEFNLIIKKKGKYLVDSHGNGVIGTGIPGTEESVPGFITVIE